MSELRHIFEAFISFVSLYFDFVLSSCEKTWTYRQGRPCGLVCTSTVSSPPQKYYQAYKILHDGLDV
jgi:hypothetical protein